jgi:DNA repair photolyase
MKRWGKLNPVRFDEKELKTDLGKCNYIFIGSSCDMFGDNVDELWILKTLEHCIKYPDNTYLFQTKNPLRFYQIATSICMPLNYVLCTTIETNRYTPQIMGNSPTPHQRADLVNECVHDLGCKTFVTIEPIMDFDLEEMLHIIETCLPEQVNIGADSGNNNLPEPSKEKILQLIKELEKFTKVKQKKNLKRLLK